MRTTSRIRVVPSIARSSLTVVRTPAQHAGVATPTNEPATFANTQIDPARSLSSVARSVNVHNDGNRLSQLVHAINGCSETAADTCSHNNAEPSRRMRVVEVHGQGVGLGRMTATPLEKQFNEQHYARLSPPSLFES